MTFENVYGDAERAAAYAGLEFPGTYYLAFRDLPAIIGKHVVGKKALDFGCGTGRSTRFLRRIGLDTVGVDIAPEMTEKARQLDAGGEYRVIEAGDLSGFEGDSYDLVLSVFTFDNIPTTEIKMDSLKGIRSLLNADGVLINLVSSPDVYLHEWASFTTKDFPENRRAKSGDRVRIVMKDVDDRRPVEDILFTDESYREVYVRAGLKLIETHRPLATGDEPFEWITETSLSPWVVYVLGKS